MILRALRVDGFGVHRDLVLDGFEPGLNVVYGENEAGKSTLLHFLRAVLYGFEEHSRGARYEPDGGKHGGSVTLEVEPGERLRVTRIFRAGRRALGDVTVEDAHGRTLDAEQALRRALGNSSRALFENVFAIGLDDLRKLHEAGIREHIYGAGMTGSGPSLPAAFDRLQDEWKKLLPKGAKGGSIGKLLDQLASTRIQVEELSSRPERHRQLVERVEALTAKVTALDGRLPAVKAARTRAERLSRAADAFGALAKLPSVPAAAPKFPDGGKKRLAQAQEAIGRAASARERVEARCAEIRARLEAASSNELLLRPFDASADSERALLAAADRFAAAETAAREARHAAEAASTEEARVRAQSQALRAEIEGIGDAGARAAKLEPLISAFEETLDEEKAAGILFKDVDRRRLAAGLEPGAQAGGGHRAAFFLAALATIAGIALLVAGKTAGGAALLLLGIALGLLASRRRPSALLVGAPSERDIEDAKTRLERAKRARRARAVLTFGRENAGDEDGRVARTQIGDLRAQAKRRTDVERFVAELEVELARVAPLAAEKASAATGADSERDASRAALTAWLEQHGLPAATSAESALSTLLAVRKAREDDARDREALRRGEDELAQSTRERAEAESARVSLLAEADAAGPEEFAARAAAAERHVAAARERDALEAKVREALGDEDSEAARDALGGTPKEALASAAKAAAQEEESLTSERDTALIERTEADTERRDLERSGELSALRTSEEAMREDLAAAAARWQAVVIAEWLLETARRKFEAEHQPHILRAASGYLATITDGRWIAIRAVPDVASDADRLRVARFDDPERLHSLETLSRGTLEQVYLSLRLALASDFPDPSVRLPLVLDDVLVNFSGARRAAAAASIAGISTRAQVIAFTCHAEMRDALLAAAKNARSMSLPDPSRPGAEARSSPGGTSDRELRLGAGEKS